MPRLFVAATLPEQVKDTLVALQRAAPAMQIAERQHLHVTLHFIGELDDGQKEKVSLALASVKIKHFPVQVRGVGQFPPDGPPQVLWVGVHGGSGLAELHQAIAANLHESIAFVQEARPYTPHVTLGRVNEPLSHDSHVAFVKQHADEVIADCDLVEFALFSSQHINSRYHYQLESTYALD